MADNEEYDRLEDERDDVRRQMAACERRIGNYNYLLERLNRAKRSIDDLKESFKKCKKEDNDLLKGKHAWKGTTYDSFSSKMSNLMEANEAYYKHSLDYILDSLNDETTRIENLRLKEKGLLGELGACLNNIINKIENFFN